MLTWSKPRQAVRSASFRYQRNARIMAAWLAGQSPASCTCWFGAVVVMFSSATSLGRVGRGCLGKPCRRRLVSGASGASGVPGVPGVPARLTAPKGRRTTSAGASM